jgi:hypothetical protein
MVLNEEALKYPIFKELFDKVVPKVHKKTPNNHPINQETELIEVSYIAKVEIESTYDSQYDAYAGKVMVCWLNLATGEFLDIGLKSERPDTWYNNHELSDSEGSPYNCVELAKNGKVSWKILYEFGNPFAMAQYGRELCAGNGNDVRKGRLLQKLAENLGVKDTPYAGAFKWSEMDEGLWDVVYPRFSKLAKYCDKKTWRSIGGLAPSICRMGKFASVYRLQYLPKEMLDVFTDGYEPQWSVKLASLCSVNQFTNEQLSSILRSCPDAYKMLTLRNSFTPWDFGILLSERWHREERIKQYGFNKFSRSYSINEWVDFLIAYDRGTESELFVNRVDWRQIDQIPTEKLIKLFKSYYYEIEEKIDWGRMAKLPLDKLILLSLKNNEVNKKIDWVSLASPLEKFDWSSITDDQRVEFAIEHEEFSSIILNCGFDPNKLRPWCLDLSYDKWPERLSTFNPDTYDWTRCSTRVWAQILYGHPEFLKYCPFDTVNWRELDKAPIKYWKWALGSFGEKIIPLFTRWNELDEDRWNDILKKQPTLVDYKKKHFKQS